MPIIHNKYAGVIGWPVHHSLSPRLHNYWLKQYNIKGTYEAFAVEPKNLQITLGELQKKNFAGINLTLPHKEEALKLVDETDKISQKIGAINTIIFKNEKRLGINTDVYGFIQNLREYNLQLADKKILIIGAGGAARAVCAGLLQENAQIILMNRTQAKAEALATALGGNIKVKAMEQRAYSGALAECYLLVNTTSLGMKGQPSIEFSLETLPADAIVTDIVYNPVLTPFLKNAQLQGNKIIDGLGMLLYQAQPAFEAWFGIKPEVTQELRDYMLKGLT